MIRMPAIILAALIAAAPLSAASAQERPHRGGSQREPQRERSEEQRPSLSMAEAVQRASAGRQGRYLGSSNRGDVIVVRWEYPGGRVADIMVDGRTGRVIGER